jgi:hypothetical protein
MTERQDLEVRGRCNRGATVPTTSGHGAAEPSEDSASHPRIVERSRFHVEANRQHATADVATDSLRIDQPRGCDHHADADVVERCTSGMTAICWTSRARRRRSIASDTSCFIGEVSQVWMGASDGSLTLTSIRKSWYERQFRRTLARDGHGDFRTEARRVSTKRAEYLRYRTVDRDDRRHLLDEQIGHAIVGAAICERQVECPLHLPAELTCLSFSLPT